MEIKVFTIRKQRCRFAQSAHTVVFSHNDKLHRIPESQGWKTWNSPSTTNYSESLNVPSWKSGKPLSFPDWDKVFSLPWK